MQANPKEWILQLGLQLLMLQLLVLSAPQTQAHAHTAAQSQHFHPTSNATPFDGDRALLKADASSNIAATCAAISKAKLSSSASSAAPKTTYTIGVLANRGVDTAIDEFTPTFVDYLNHELGETYFDPPISFQLLPVGFQGLLDDAAAGKFDFIFANPSILSCIESEVGASVLATLINKRKVGSVSYDLDQFGGVIFTLAGNDEINTLQDLKQKKAACVSITGLGSGQMQFQQLQRDGFHHIQDLRQLLFLGSQTKVVDHVLQGKIEVGFVRTDQLQRSTDPATGEALDLSKIKIINKQSDVVDINGDPFPFEVSTDLFPEWGVIVVNSDTRNVPLDVTRRVQDALLSIADHAAVAQPLDLCYQQNGCDAIAAGGSDPVAALIAQEQCEEACYDNLTASEFVDCTTTMTSARLALAAMTKGRYAGWRTALNYMQLRNMQEETGFIRINRDGSNSGNLDGPRCIRTTELADAVVCPDGYRKKSNKDIETGCESIGLPCDGYSCLCSPCTKIETCEHNTVRINGNCISLSILLPSIIVPFFVLIGVGVFLWTRHLQSQTDSLWKIKTSELAFYNPPRVLGRGTFGLVLLAEYRGTKVAVKRVLPSRSSNSRQKENLDSFMASPFDYLDRTTTSKTPTALRLQSTAGESMVDSVGLPLDVASGTGMIGGNASTQTGSFKDEEMAVPSHYKARSKQIDPATGLPENFGFKSGFFPSSYKSSRSFNLKSHNWSHISTATKTRDVSKLQTDFIDEMRQISRLRHPCITTVMGAVINRRSESMLVMEFMELGSLYDFLHNDTIAIENKMAINLLQDVAQGLRFLHSAEPGIVHGDLKSLNVLVDGRFRAKVADFGFSQKHLFRKSASGTPFWMAPELLRGESTNTPESDIFSFGILIYEVFTRKDPYEDGNHREVLRLISDKTVQKRPPVPKDAPIELQFLMKECLRDSPSMRPSAESIDQRLKQVEVVPTEIKSSHLQRSDEMWSKRFPYRVARSLKLGMEVQPQSHPAVSLFSCKVVNHSDIISSLPPQRASELMNLFHKTIDNLCQVHNVFRIETVGDSFLAVTNVAFDQPDHVRILTNFALEVMETFSEMRIDNPGPLSKPRSPSIEHGPIETKDESTQSGEQSTAQAESTQTPNTPSSPSRHIRIRVGLHTGSVVAHVVGSANPRFAILGDAVKVAKKLEECAKPNKIHVSQDFAFELLQDAEDNQNDSVTLIRVEDVQVRKQLNMVTYYVRQASAGDTQWGGNGKAAGSGMASAGSRSTARTEANSSEAEKAASQMQSAQTVRSVLDKVRRNQELRIQSASAHFEVDEGNEEGEFVLPLSKGDTNEVAAVPASNTATSQASTTITGLDKLADEQKRQRGHSPFRRRLSKSSAVSSGSAHSVRSDELYYKQIMESG